MSRHINYYKHLLNCPHLKWYKTNKQTNIFKTQIYSDSRLFALSVGAQNTNFNLF